MWLFLYGPDIVCEGNMSRHKPDVPGKFWDSEVIESELDFPFGWWFSSVGKVIGHGKISSGGILNFVSNHFRSRLVNISVNHG